MSEHAPPGSINVGQAVVIIPNNSRDRFPATGGTTNPEGWAGMTRDDGAGKRPRDVCHDDPLYALTGTTNVKFYRA